MSSDLLIGIPCISGIDHCTASINSVIKQGDVVIVDNSGTGMFGRNDCYCIDNPQNNYVNGSWCQILHFFLHNPRYDYLIIMNSDLIMGDNWIFYLENDVLCIPTDGSHHQDVVVTEGTPGVFIYLNRKMANMVYPIPDYIRIWFGDNWVFGILRQLGYQTVVKAGLLCEHYNGGSQSVNIVPDKEAIIEKDKVNWALYGEKDIQERVNKWK